MRTPPTNWAEIMAKPHETETKLVVHDGNGGTTEYFGFDGTSGIYSCATHPMLFDKMSVGNCCSSQIDLTLVQASSNWWKKSTIAYAYGEFEEREVLENYRLYRRMKVVSGYGTSILEVGVTGDYIDADAADVAQAIADGYIYHFVDGWGVVRIESISDEIENAYVFVLASKSRTSDDDIAIECEFIENVTASSPSAHPQYGEQDGYWYEYTGSHSADIPRMAKMELYVRLKDAEGNTTDWVKKGVYFIDTREWDAQHEFLTITGYDPMLKAEQPYYKPPVTITGWPRLDTVVVAEICQRIGVPLDSRTTLNKHYQIAMPSVSSDGEGSNTLREVLGWIGAAYGGNWCITDDGKLRLVPLVPTNTPIAIGTDAIDLTTMPQYDAIGTVNLIVGDNGEEYTEGSTGREIDITCPYGTQDMAYNLLTTLRGFAYQPLTVTTAFEADPLWELGDAISVNGFTSQIADMPTAFGLKYTVDVTAGGDEEIDHEYPYVDKEQQQTERKIAQTRAALTIDIDSIDQRVTTAEGEVTALTLSVGQLSTEVSRKNTTYSSDYAPNNPKSGDLWFCTYGHTSGGVGYEADTWYRYNGASWEKTTENINVVPPWTLGVEYSKGDVAEVDGKWYEAKSNHTATNANKPPNSSYWTLKQTVVDVTKSQITQEADRINARIDGVSGTVTQLDLRVGQISSEVSGKINGQQAQSLINQTMDTLSLSVSGTDGTTIFQLKQGSAILDTKQFDIHVDSVNIEGTLGVNKIKLYGDMDVYIGASSATVGGSIGYTTSTLDANAGIHMYRSLSAYGKTEVRCTGYGAAMTAQDPNGFYESEVVCTSNRVTIRAGNSEEQVVRMYVGNGGNYWEFRGNGIFWSGGKHVQLVND